MAAAKLAELSKQQAATGGDASKQENTRENDDGQKPSPDDGAYDGWGRTSATDGTESTAPKKDGITAKGTTETTAGEKSSGSMDVEIEEVFTSGTKEEGTLTPQKRAHQESANNTTKKQKEKKSKRAKVSDSTQKKEGTPPPPASVKPASARSSRQNKNKSTGADSSPRRKTFKMKINETGQNITKQWLPQRLKFRLQKQSWTKWRREFWWHQLTYKSALEQTK